MLSEGYIHPRSEHTRPAGIWRKLQALYDLDALDEREDARQLSDLSIESGNDSEDADDDVYSEAGNKIHREDFALPDDDEFAVLKWRQRFAVGEERGDESPPLLPELNMAGEPPVRFTPSFSVEPSEAATPSARGGRARASTARGRGRGAAAVSVPVGGGTRRSARQQAESVAGDDQQSGAGDDAEEEESKESESEDEEESEEGSTPARSTRATGRGRGRGAARGRGRGRSGRGK